MYIPMWVIFAAVAWWLYYCWSENRHYWRMMRDKTPKTEEELNVEYAAHERRYKHLHQAGRVVA
jgi:hypothetical protein